MKNQIKVEPALIDSLVRALSLLAGKSNSVNALQEIIDSINSESNLTFDPGNADILRDAAISLEMHDLNTSYDLMTLAKEIRPSGLFIIQRLDEYQSMRKVLSDGEFKIGGLNFEFGEPPTYAILRAFSTGKYEHRETELVKKSIADGEVVLELGSGLGFMGVVANSHVGCAQYVAYEANPKLIQIINNNMKRNNVQFEVRNKLLFDGRGSHSFYVTKAFWASSLIKPKHADFEEFRVESDDKNEIMKELKPSMLIIDIEGGEYAFFDDLNLSSVSKIILEVHPSVLSNLELSTMFRNILNAGFVWDFATFPGNVVYFHRLS